MDDRRRAPRQRAFLQGRVYYNNRRASVDCLVRDISECGARLQFSSAVTLPEAIELFIPNKDHVCRARIAWRQEDQVGVEMLEHGQAQASESPDPVEQRLSKLEAEVAAMRRVLQDMQRSAPANAYSGI